MSTIRAQRNKAAHIERAMIGFAFAAILFWTVQVVDWALTGVISSAVLVVYPAAAIAGGVAFYILLPRQRRPRARRIVLMLVGTLLIGVAYASGRGNMQIEGLFFGLLISLGLPVVLHYAIAKLFGPLAFGRIWCGWACWYSMLFDLLPYPSGDRRIDPRWGWLRYGHFALSLTAVLLLWSLGYRDGALGQSGQTWFLVGLLSYHALGIVLAMVLHDNRAFCKYLCPLAVPLKAASRFSLLKVTGSPTACSQCAHRTCVTVCPMNIRIPDYVQAGERVLSTECILCQECINTCPDEALKLSLGWDIGGKELLDVKERT